MTYLLVYRAVKNGENITGSVCASGKLPSLKDIRGAEDQLKERSNFDDVVITNMFEIADAEEKEK